MSIVQHPHDAECGLLAPWLDRDLTAAQQHGLLSRSAWQECLALPSHVVADCLYRVSRQRFFSAVGISRRTYQCIRTYKRTYLPTIVHAKVTFHKDQRPTICAPDDSSVRLAQARARNLPNHWRRHLVRPSSAWWLCTGTRPW